MNWTHFDKTNFFRWVETETTNQIWSLLAPSGHIDVGKIHKNDVKKAISNCTNDRNLQFERSKRAKGSMGLVLYYAYIYYKHEHEMQVNIRKMPWILWVTPRNGCFKPIPEWTARHGSHRRHNASVTFPICRRKHKHLCHSAMRWVDYHHAINQIGVFLLISGLVGWKINYYCGNLQLAEDSFKNWTYPQFIYQQFHHH